MALLRVCQRSNAFSANGKFSARFSSNQSPKSKGDNKLPYWHAATGGKVKDFKQIPGPKYLPLIGHEWRYNKMFGIYDRDYVSRTFAKMFRQYGPVVKEYIGRDRAIVHLFHPDDIGTVYNHERLFPNRTSHRVMARYRKERPHLYDSPGLGPSNGLEWRSFREEFVKDDGLYLWRGQINNLESVADDLITRVQSNLDKNGEVDVMPFLYRWTLESIGIVTLKRRLGCLDPVPIPEADRLIEASHITNDVVYRTEMMESGHEEQYQRLIPAEDYFAGVIRKYIDETIEELPRSPKNEFLSSILKPETKLNDLYTFVLDLFHAGIHTTAVTTAFALYHLALNRNVQEKLRLEILKELPTKGSRYADSSLAMSNNYLLMVIRETLRLNPPTIGNGRVLQAPLALGGYNVPASTMVLLHHQVASLQEENFGDAQKFIPERWVRPPDEIKNPYRTYAWKPFGSGRRQCAGHYLAREELQLAVSKFVRNFDISYHHEKIDVVNRLHNEPDRPVRLQLRPLN
ncbi:hypothetical protein JTE90_004878 [Oedothorax gibbosus]|uniref:Cytochrome P450 n=1 Tax=Oedothorax gibbosus TaxID=931172 RepID=A0AAV6URP8_9ARAC|nr:hypothetical protein JTE90_004878 [Oedothorax gibbosus]